MITAYIFSITIQQPNSTIAYLKAYPRLPLIKGKIPKPHKTYAIEENGDRIKTITCLGKITACCYHCFREKLKTYCQREKLSCSYCWGKNVYLLPYNQLASQEYRGEKIEHRVIRKKKFKHQDLKLHPIERKDRGDMVELPIYLTLQQPQWQCQLRKNQKKWGVEWGLIQTINQIDFWEKDFYYYNIVECGRIKTVGQGKEKIGMWSTIPDHELNYYLKEQA